jgi:hypothetical protein
LALSKTNNKNFCSQFAKKQKTKKQKTKNKKQKTKKIRTKKQKPKIFLELDSLN